MDQYTLRDIFLEIELELIESMRRTLARHEREERDRGFQWEQWQRAKLRNLSQFRKDNANIIALYHEDIMNTIEEVLNMEYQDAYKQSLKLFDEIEMDFAGMDNSTPLGELEVMEDDFFHVNDEKVKSMIEVMQSDFSIDNKILRKMDDVYKQTLNKAVLEVGTGSKTIKQAVDGATKDFLTKGIDCITYSDGRKVNISSYAEMYLRTASQRAKFMADGKVRDRIGIYFILVSQHANCCPMCLKWQRRVLIDDVFTSLSRIDALKLSRETGYPLLSEAMNEGLFHPNCRHNLTTWIPGHSTMPKEFAEQDKAKALENYQQEQHQRLLERIIREWKRIAEGSLDEGNKKKAIRNVSYYQKLLRDKVKANPNLRRDYWRERI